MPAEPFNLLYKVGRTSEGSLWVEMRFDGTRLSISGVIGPRSNGDAFGSCGQIAGDLDRIIDYAPGWDEAKAHELAEIWKTWHLNDMQAGCAHQRGAGWDKRPIDPRKPTDAYGRHFHGQTHDSWNLLCWVRPDEHPDGLLTKPCDECGYRYGTAWLTVEVPDEILTRLRSFRAADPRQYPWRQRTTV